MTNTDKLDKRLAAHSQYYKDYWVAKDQLTGRIVGLSKNIDHLLDQAHKRGVRIPVVYKLHFGHVILTFQ